MFKLARVIAARICRRPFAGIFHSRLPLRLIHGLICCLGLALPIRAWSLDHNQLAVIINTADPLSVQIGEYYSAQRRILFQNIIRISFPPGKSTLTAKEFGLLKAEVDEKTLHGVEAYALTWATPFRVECMSITSAFAFGFDPEYCASTCTATRASPYFNSRVRQPFTQSGIRPAMAIAAANFEQARALIDRGVEADGSFPGGTAYFVSTADANRNVRSTTYPVAERLLRGRLRSRIIHQDVGKNLSDVLFYFTGVATVDGLDTLRFVPGAVADHLTSYGGVLTGGTGQMSAMRWLEAGATGSYGTVVEPCNLPQKFPSPAVLIAHYLAGATLIEAYWKSVAMPGQGIFIGEPLAAPFRSLEAQ